MNDSILDWDWGDALEDDLRDALADLQEAALLGSHTDVQMLIADARRAGATTAELDAAVRAGRGC